MNNEQNKLLAALVGEKCWHEATIGIGGPNGCPRCLITDYFADPPHSKIVELVGKAVEKWGSIPVQAAFIREAKRIGVDVIVLDASAKASVIVNLIKEQDAK